jgi:hypothetical protein
VVEVSEITFQLEAVGEEHAALDSVNTLFFNIEGVPKLAREDSQALCM